MPQYSIHSRSGRSIAILEFSSDQYVRDVRRELAQRLRLAVERVNLTNKPRATNDRKTLVDEQQLASIDAILEKSQQGKGTQQAFIIYYKDLGPQIAWKTVFHVEYFGPILVHALNFFMPKLFYPQYANIVRNFDFGQYTLVQKVAFALVILHYVKRELETHFVHRFSNATMPAFNIFKNSFHYWVLGGVSISYFLYHPYYTSKWGNNAVYVFAVAFLLSELGNLSAHITLRNLRKPGTRERGNPRGGLFELVSCANYTYEISAWLIFSVMVSTVPSWIFLAVSTVQISQWALKKHNALRKEFGVKGRKALIPFLL